MREAKELYKPFFWLLFSIFAKVFFRVQKKRVKYVAKVLISLCLRLAAAVTSMQRSWLYLEILQNI